MADVASHALEVSPQLAGRQLISLLHSGTHIPRTLHYSSERDALENQDPWREKKLRPSDSNLRTREGEVGSCIQFDNQLASVHYIFNCFSVDFWTKIKYTTNIGKGSLEI